MALPRGSWSAEPSEHGLSFPAFPCVYAIERDDQQADDGLTHQLDEDGLRHGLRLGDEACVAVAPTEPFDEREVMLLDLVSGEGHAALRQRLTGEGLEPRLGRGLDVVPAPVEVGP